MRIRSSTWRHREQSGAGGIFRFHNYFSVDDVAASTAKAKSLGGTVVMDVTAIPRDDTAGVVIDPTGAAFGIWQTTSQ